MASVSVKGSSETTNVVTDTTNVPTIDIDDANDTAAASGAGRPSTDKITSPVRSPALAAGLPSTTASTAVLIASIPSTTAMVRIRIIHSVRDRPQAQLAAQSTSATKT